MMIGRFEIQEETNERTWPDCTGGKQSCFYHLERKQKGEEQEEKQGHLQTYKV